MEVLRGHAKRGMASRLSGFSAGTYVFACVSRGGKIWLRPVHGKKWTRHKEGSSLKAAWVPDKELKREWRKIWSWNICKSCSTLIDFWSARNALNAPGWVDPFRGCNLPHDIDSSETSAGLGYQNSNMI